MRTWAPHPRFSDISGTRRQALREGKGVKAEIPTMSRKGLHSRVEKEVNEPLFLVENTSELFLFFGRVCS